MILRVCEACEKPAPPGPARDPHHQAALSSGAVERAHVPAGWTLLQYATGTDAHALGVADSTRVDLCSPRCLRVWAEAHAGELEEELGVADALGPRDVVAYQHRAGAPTLEVHRARLREVEHLAEELEEQHPNPMFAPCPACGAPAGVPCQEAPR